jgi:hypothetical protein
MNRRRVLTGGPVVAAYGFVAAIVGRLFGAERRKRMSAGVLWEAGPGSADFHVTVTDDTGRTTTYYP